MTTINEYTRASRWLATTLDGITDVTGIYEAAAPQDATFPCITFDQAEAEDLTVVGENRVWAAFTFQVVAVTKGLSTLAIEAIADAIDSRLHRGSGTTSDGRVVQSTRLEPFHDRPIEDGVTYVRLGGLYQLLVQPLDA